MSKKVKVPSYDSSYWNYRIGTRLKGVTRSYSIIEVYYDKDGEPKGYCREYSNLLGEWEDVDSIVHTHKLIKHAFSKPIIDLDRFPELHDEEVPPKPKKKEKKSK